LHWQYQSSGYFRQDAIDQFHGGFKQDTGRLTLRIAFDVPVFRVWRAGSNAGHL
jgi:hypothetical protein